MCILGVYYRLYVVFGERAAGDFFFTFPASQIRFSTFSETISERVSAEKRKQNPKFRPAGQSLICHPQDLVKKPGG